MDLPLDQARVSGRCHSLSHNNVVKYEFHSWKIRNKKLYDRSTEVCLLKQTETKYENRKK